MPVTIPQLHKRIQSIDVLRGIVMVLMALDHTRDYFSGFPFEPTELDHTNGIMFFTRWITHYCAPVFIFLSGTSVFLSQGRKQDKKQAAFRLLTRGIWLLFLELTIIRFGWMFDLNYHFIVLQVIWAIGWSMIFLSAVIFLPMPAILAIGLVMVLGHNMLDNIHATGSMAIPWQLLHVQSPISYGSNSTIFIAYPLLPWLSVMALGYCFGALFRKEEKERNKSLYLIGALMIGSFIMLRFTNAYGDPSPWSVQPIASHTIMSFINCTKYPPSLLYLLMTLGPAIFLMPLLERMNGHIGGIFKVFGRVPFFYYILHLYLIHGLSLFAANALHAPMMHGVYDHPGYSIAIVYACWISCVTILYFPCRWFMHVKMNNKQWWLSYL